MRPPPMPPIMPPDCWGAGVGAGAWRAGAGRAAAARGGELEPRLKKPPPPLPPDERLFELDLPVEKLVDKTDLPPPLGILISKLKL